jgi:hypothetical protein
MATQIGPPIIKVNFIPLDMLPPHPSWRLHHSRSEKLTLKAREILRPEQERRPERANST